MIGLSGVVGGIVWFNQVLSIVQSSVKTQGEIVELQIKRNFYHLVVRFEPTPDNIKHLTTKVGRYNKSVDSNIFVGQKMTVLYDEKDPDKARSGELLDLWVFPSALIFIGIIFCLWL